MTDDGYPDGSYRLVLQSYPAPVPSATENRYPELGVVRTSKGGCPMWNDDSDWAHNTVVPNIADMLQNIAKTAGLDFLDVRNLFAGHEVCARSASQASEANSLSNPLLGKDAEWVRFLTKLETQGQFQESIHPNYYGQLALGACLTKLSATPANQKNHVCTNIAGKGPDKVNLTSTAWT